MSGMNRIGRRRFVQLMGWAGAVAVAQGGPAFAQAARKPKAASKPPEPTPAPSPAPSATTPAISEEARALGEVVKRRYGERLTPEELEAITRDLDGDLRGIQRLREAKLANADEPDTTFHA
jgi:hypothetical protein